MISYILVFIGAMVNALMDVLENENFTESPITKKWNPKFWYKRESWKYSTKVIGYRVDGWHLCKSTWICLLMASIILYHPVLKYWDFLILGVIHNVTFSFFYHKVFKA